jgi:hypothetical protein
MKMCIFFKDLLYIIKIRKLIMGEGTWWCSWFRHCATNQKVAGSIPDDVSGIFH